jgi:hypothetical protein
MAAGGKDVLFQLVDSEGSNMGSSGYVTVDVAGLSASWLSVRIRRLVALQCPGATGGDETRLRFVTAAEEGGYETMADADVQECVVGGDAELIIMVCDAQGGGVGGENVQHRVRGAQGSQERRKVREYDREAYKKLFEHDEAENVLVCKDPQCRRVCIPQGAGLRNNLNTNKECAYHARYNHPPGWMGELYQEGDYMHQQITTEGVRTDVMARFPGEISPPPPTAICSQYVLFCRGAQYVVNISPICRPYVVHMLKCLKHILC